MHRRDIGGFCPAGLNALLHNAGFSWYKGGYNLKSQCTGKKPSRMGCNPRPRGLFHNPSSFSIPELFAESQIPNRDTIPAEAFFF